MTNDDTSHVLLAPEQILQVKTAARRLQDEFAGTFSVETIERYIADSQTRSRGEPASQPGYPS